METTNLFNEMLGSKPQDPKGLIPIFHIEAVLNEVKTAAEGRPIYEDKVYLKIIIPGDSTSIVDQEVTDFDKKRFPEAWARWKETGENTAVGTPLRAWPGITRSQAEELAYFQIKTVEQLAEMSDGNCARFPGGNALKQRAKDYLAAANSGAGVTQLRAELDKRNADYESLKALLKEQSDQLAELKKSMRR